MCLLIVIFSGSVLPASRLIFAKRRLSVELELQRPGTVEKNEAMCLGATEDRRAGQMP